MQVQDAPLLSLLEQRFGFDSFLPLQEDIVRDALRGRDVLALLPTGGGKSLCFQLPALARPGLTLVISPLIALMKDQVDALGERAIEATYVNSSLSPHEVQARMRGLRGGRYRLLYVAPERVMQAPFLDALGETQVSLVAIDEAHCISEWGHDFRPEYRQLADLRDRFPAAAFMAMTATATERVRRDIVEQLRLRDPGLHIGSFNRRNLTYRVRPKYRAYEQLLAFLRARPGESGIVYCRSRARTEQLAGQLSEDGVHARPYHAGLPPEVRTEHQEAFTRDEAPVICATIAFGMGINKPDVRFVVHYDLPKSIEAYYQETGRSGRDGLPAECLLLYSAGDRIWHERFIEEKPDPREQQIAREQLQHLADYAESGECRRRMLLRYFGEAYDRDNCGACDNCESGGFNATELARKFLAAVYRIKEKTGFGFGVTHTADVLRGANTEAVCKWGHNQLTVFGKGREQKREEWSLLSRELLRLGHLSKTENGSLEVTTLGREVLIGEKSVFLDLPATVFSSRRQHAPNLACDEPLFQRLSDLRLRLSREREVAAFTIFHDSALRRMARDYPTNEAQFRRIPGVGDQKLRDFGPLFMQEIAAYLQSNAPQTFEDDAPFFTAPRLGASHRQTLEMFNQGCSLGEIAARRGLAPSTIEGHLADCAEAGEEVPLPRFLDAAGEREVQSAFAALGWANVRGAYERLGERYSYGALRIYRAHALKAREATPSSPRATPAHTTESPARSPASAPAPA